MRQWTNKNTRITCLGMYFYTESIYNVVHFKIDDFASLSRYKSNLLTVDIMINIEDNHLFIDKFSYITNDRLVLKSSVINALSFRW
jgi:hypothetical protein